MPKVKESKPSETDFHFTPPMGLHNLVYNSASSKHSTYAFTGSKVQGSEVENLLQISAVDHRQNSTIIRVKDPLTLVYSFWLQQKNNPEPLNAYKLSNQDIKNVSPKAHHNFRHFKLQSL